MVLLDNIDFPHPLNLDYVNREEKQFCLSILTVFFLFFFWTFIRKVNMINLDFIEPNCITDIQ